MKRTIIIAVVLLMFGCRMVNPLNEGALRVKQFRDRVTECDLKMQAALGQLQYKVETVKQSNDGLSRTIVEYGRCMDALTEDFGL